MSPYGTLSGPRRPDGPLHPRLYNTSKSNVKLAVFPFIGSDLPAEVASILHDVFSGVVEEGKTYPQELVPSSTDFASYFLGHDLMVGILIDRASAELPENGQDDPALTLELCRGSRPWESCLAGCYYVKPNYPGRSSHCCNAGFIVAPQHRGLKLGMALGRSYLHFGPRLGYRASVFNLVYVNNVASLAIWDRLGFTRAGLIPEAGRLKTGPNSQEEYVDAVVYYKAFGNSLA